MKRYLALTLFLFAPLLTAAQREEMLNFSQPLVIDQDFAKSKSSQLFGVYITDIYNLNSAEGTFSVEYRAWSRGPKSARKGYMEFPHARSTKFTGGQVIQYRDSLWGLAHISSTYHFDWDMSEFPFDRQTLRIECENTTDANFMELAGDIENSGIAEGAIQSGFVITDVRFFTENHVASSNFGNPLLGQDEASQFSTFVAEIDIQRDSPWTLFLKVFSAVIVSFFIATITFVVNPGHFDARLSLTIGALFAAVGSKFVVDAFVGISTELMLMDRIYILTYLLIFLLAVLLLISHKIYLHADERKKERILSRKFDLMAFTGMNILYVASISAMVAAA